MIMAVTAILLTSAVGTVQKHQGLHARAYWPEWISGELLNATQRPRRERTTETWLLFPYLFRLPVYQETVFSFGFT